jgi:periplasmic protein TonB
MKTDFESFDDIVFENRNKDYGAYELRKHYSRRGNIALSISILFVLIAVGAPLIANIMKHQTSLTIVDIGGPAVLDGVPDEKPDVPKLPEPPKPDFDKDVKFDTPEIVDSVKEDIELGTVDDMLMNANKLPVDTSTRLIEYVEKVDDLDEKIYDDIIVLTERPEFPGGDNELMKYLSEHVTYPVLAVENRIQGTVYIRFVVTKTGDVGETTVYKASDPLLNEEALRVVKSLPKWTPGKMNGFPVNVWFLVPIKFRLQD